MVTGNEYIFENIDEALKYVMDLERKALASDLHRQKPPIIARQIPGMFSQPFSEEMAMKAFVPVDSLDYSLSAWFNGAAEDKFVMTRLNSGRYSLKPNLRQRKYLFRGESEFHNPCKPNLSRNPKQKRFTKELLKGQEMMLLMMSHPLVQLLDLGVELNGELYRFEMNLFGLTQHYYNKTSLLDLTSDPQVATFFATTKYDWDTDVYSPIEEKDSEIGVLYYYNLDIDQDFGMRMDGTKSPLSTIGLQVFPRSGRQKGFLYDVRTDENFNDVAQVQAVRFYQRADVSERIWNGFNEGKDLFPEDILMKHWRLNNANRNVVSSRTIKMNQILNPEMTLDEVETEARSLGLEIEDYVPSFTDEELDQYYASVQNDSYWQNFCNQIHIPGDNDGKMMNDLQAVPQNPNYRWAFEHDESHVTDWDKGYVLKIYKDCLK